MLKEADREDNPVLLLTTSTAKGNAVRTNAKPAAATVNRELQRMITGTRPEKNG